MQKKKNPKRERTPEEIKYIEAYNKENTVQKAFRFHNVIDNDILAWCIRQRNFQGRLKELIRADMERRKGGQN